MQLHLDLIQLCKLEGLPRPVREFRFCPDRKFRLDYAFVPQKLAVEIEGGIWIQGRHTRGFGFLNDMTKYNLLAINGWSLLRFTPGMVNSGEAIGVIKEWFESRKNA